MADAPKTMELATAAGISKSYASEIVNGIRPPSRPLAIHIFRKTGWRHALIRDLTDAQLAVFEQVEPWTAPADRPDAPTTPETARAA